MKVRSHFGWLLAGILASVALVAVDALLPQSAAWMAVLPVIPLAVYHAYLRLGRARDGLTAAETDSVYYFGFLITVAALAATAVEISTAGAEVDLLSVLQKFGVGLAATGYAVIARMHLQSLAGREAALSPDVLLERVVARTAGMLEDLNATAYGLTELSNTIQIQTKQVIEAAQREIEESTRQSARLFEDELRTSLTAVREGVQDLRVLMSETQFTEERRRFKEAMATAVETAEASDTALRLVASRADAAAESLARCEAGFDGVNVGASQLGATLGKLNQEQAALSGTADLLRATTVAASNAAEAARAAAEESVRVGRELADLRAGLQRAGTAAGDVAGQFATLRNAGGSLGAVLEDSATALRHTTEFAGNLGLASSALPVLTSRVGELSSGLDSLHGRLAASSKAIEEDVKRSTSAASKLADSLTSVAQVIIDRTRERVRA